jgi:alcohol dehydrogenase class IV
VSDDSELAFTFWTPTRVVYGPGCARDVRIELETLGCRRTYVVTDPGVAAAGLLEPVVHALGDNCAGVFDQVPQDSDSEIVEKLAASAREARVDSLASLGGGSVIDTAKAAAVLLTEGGTLADQDGFQMLGRAVTPHLSIPTTAGTGSEVTFAAVVKDRALRQKRVLFDHHLAPGIAILDPQLLLSLPPRITAFTGMDAVTHAVEALHSLQADPMTDAMALHALRLARTFLPICVHDGGNLAARGRMQVAATLAGWAFSNAMLGVVHALAHSLGALFGVPHGLANAILLPHGMRFNLGACPERYALAAEALGARKSGMDDEQAALAAVEALADLAGAMGLPLRLQEVGVTREGLKECAELALSDGSIVYNPRPVSKADEVLEILKRAF